MVSVSAIVFASVPTVCGPASVSPVPSRTAVSTRLHLGWEFVPSACMEALMQYFQAAEFSEEVSRFTAAPRSPSKNLMYSSSALLARPLNKELIRLVSELHNVASFLFLLFETHGLSTQTIKGYMSCLALVLCRTGNAESAYGIPGHCSGGLS